MPHGRVGSQELSVEGGVAQPGASVEGGVPGFGGGQFFGEEGKQSPGTSNKLLENSSNMQI